MAAFNQVLKFPSRTIAIVNGWLTVTRVYKTLRLAGQYGKRPVNCLIMAEKIAPKQLVRMK